MASVIRVLYVDDEPDLLDICRMILEKTGDFSVATVDSAHAALDLLGQEQFDAIISDYQMPVMDGIHFLIEVRGKFGDLPFILFTGKGREEVVIQAINNGVDFYLQKGGEPQSQFAELVHKVRQAVQRRKAEKEVSEAGERYKTLISVSNTGAWEYYSDAGFVWCSPEYFSMLGRDVGQFDMSGAANLKEAWNDLLHPDDQERASRHFSEYLLNGSVGMYENKFRMQHADGHWVWIWSRGWTLRNKDGLLTNKTIGTHIDITGQMLADAELRESEEKFRLLIDNSHDIIYTVNPEGILTFVSPSWTSLLGHPVDQVIGKPFQQFVHTDDVARCLESMQDAINTGLGQVSIEYRVKHTDGSWQWHNTNAVAIRDASGTIIGVEGIASDITERKRAEEALRQHQAELTMQNEELHMIQEDLIVSREEYQDLYDLAPAGYFTISEKGLILKANLSAATLLSVERATLLKRPLSHFIMPDDQDRYYLHIRRLADTKQRQSFELRMLHQGGTLFWAQVVVVPAPEGDGEKAAYNLVVIDISERKQAEEDLRVSLVKYKTLFKTFPLGVTVSDPEGRILESNPMAEILLGLPQKEHPRRKIDGEEWRIVRPDGTPMPAGEYASVRALKEKCLVENVEMGIVRRGGEVTWISVTAAPLQLEGYGVVITYGDITGRKRAEGAVEASVTLNQLIDSMSVSDSMGYTLEEAERLTSSTLGFFHVVNPDEKTIQLVTWSTNTRRQCNIPREPERVYPVSKAGVWVDCLRERKPVIHNDYASLPHKMGMPEGHVPVIRELVVPIFDEDKIVAIIGVGNKATDYDERDINVLTLLAKNAWTLIQRKQAEERLSQNEWRQRLALQTGHIGAFEVDLESGNGIWTPELAEIWGIPDNFTGNFVDYCWEHTHPADLSRIRGEFVQVGQSPNVSEMEFRILRPDGTLRWITWKGRVIKDPSRGNMRVIGVNMDITGRKVAEEALKKSEEEYRRLVEQSSDGFWLLDKEFLTVYVNPAMEKMLGYSKEEMTGRSWYDFGDPEWVLRAKELEKRRESGIDEPHEFLFIHKDGRNVLTRISTTPLYDNDGSFDGAIGVLSDITMQKQAEEALAKSEDRFRGIFDTITSGVAIYEVNNDGASGRDYIIKDFNRTALELEGKKKEDVVGKRLSDLRPAIDDYGLIPVFRQVWKTGVPGYFPQKIYIDEKYSSWYENRVFRLQSGEIVAVYDDITGRKRSEEALKASEEKYRLMFTTMINGFTLLEMMYDESGKPVDCRYVDVNPAHEKLTGLKKEEIIGRTARESIPGLEDYWIENYGRVDQTGTPWYFENYVQELNRWYGVFVYRTAPGFVAVTFEDITGRRQAEEALNQANRKLNLLSSITRHDINNQLMSVNGFLELLHQNVPDPTLQDFFTRITKASSRISAMIQFTKEYEQIGVNAPVWQDSHTLVGIAEKEAPLGKVTVNNDLPAGTEVFADPLVVKVFYNLMDNAVRYGGKITSIRFTVLDRNGDRVIVFEDDGVGVPEGEKEKIFERGFGKNTGLGLALSREILDITGITIKETGEPGKGARFEIAVPKGAWRLTGGDI